MTLRDPLGSALGCLLLLGEQSVALFVLCAADIDRKTATPAALDVHRLELAASDAVKDSLARDVEGRCCLLRVTQPGGISGTIFARSSSSTRMCHGPPGVSWVPAMNPWRSQR